MDQLKIFFPRIAVLLLSFILACCAGQIPPSGGPPDTEPPQIIRTDPDTNAVRVSTDRIVLEFSEYVDRRSVEESIFISPFVGELQFDWSGTEVLITFSEPLKPRTTYVVNVGTDVKDIRAGNRMAHGFTLAFSTGDSIDQGMITGRVFDDKPEGVMIFAYALSGLDPDTLNPATAKPDYIMQSGKDGTFTLSNIRYDRYRLLAVRDQYRNLVYDKQIDEIGMPVCDIQLSNEHPRGSNVWFRLTREDTARPFLTRVVAVSRRQLSLRFSEPLDTLLFPQATITLEDTLTNSPVGIMLQSLDRLDSTAAVVLTSASLDSGKTYRLSIANVRDRTGNMIDSASSSATFEAVGTIDTASPSLTFVGLRDSVKAVPLSGIIHVHFSEPVDTLAFHSGLQLLDSAKNSVPFLIRWSTVLDLWVAPKAALASNAWYSIRVQMDSLRDFWGNAYKDSVLSLNFQALDLRTTGTIEGAVLDDNPEENQGDIVLTAERVQSQSPHTATLRLKRPGEFTIDRIPEGFYTLHAYRDRDSSGTYSFGSPFPFHPAERFVVYSDTVKVRARWSVEGVILKLPPLPGQATTSQGRQR
ncbi:MAG TPA: Ig-like domain-containing protein [Bacteroidota bacterium]|nr:Ig-like domain-containing protein [Bacteroidota bacterium]